jgi:hypothetical protein
MCNYCIYYYVYFVVDITEFSIIYNLVSSFLCLICE